MADAALWGSEDGRAGPAILLGLLGAAIGAPAGSLVGGLLASMTICRAGGGAMGESCGMAALVFTGLGVPIGAVVGGVTGAVTGGRRGITDDSGAVTSATPIEHEASIASWLAIVGGLAIAYGAFCGWRTVHYAYADRFTYRGELTPGPEVIAVLGGLVVLTGASLRVLRPKASTPTSLLGIGTLLAIAGVTWGYLDLSDVPATLEIELFVGYWMSLVGTGLAMAGWLLDRRGSDRDVSAASSDATAGARPPGRSRRAR